MALKTLWLAGCLSSGILQQDGPWHFHFLSAFIGALLAFMLSAFAYAYRADLGAAWAQIRAYAEQFVHYLRASVEENYREQIITYARKTHTALPGISPAETFVEPAITAHIHRASTLEELEVAPAASITLPLHRAMGEHQQLIATGPPGSGRTTLLTYLAFVNAHIERKTKEGIPSPDLYLNRLPFCLQLSTMDWKATDEGPITEANTDQASDESQPSESPQEPIDSVDRLLRAALTTVSGNMSWSKTIRPYLAAQKAMILVDGWDELLPVQQRLAVEWLSDLTHALPGNLWIVSTGTRGYAPLTEIGFVPVRPQPWNRAQLVDLIQQWIDAIRPEQPPSPSAINRLVAELERRTNSGMTSLEIALVAYLFLAYGEFPEERVTLFDQAFELLIWDDDNPWLLAACRGALGTLGQQALQSGEVTIRREAIIEAVNPLLPPSEDSTSHAARTVIRALTGKDSILRSVGGGQFKFTHPLWRSYFAARQLVTEDPIALISHINDPLWTEVLGFYAEIGDIEPLVATLISDPDDLIHTQWRTLMRWVSGTPEDTPWRNGAMRKIVHGFLQPSIPLAARRALARNLAQANISGVKYLFTQAMKNDDRELRIAGAEGLAMLADETDLVPLQNAILTEDPGIIEAVVEGLATVKLDAITRWLERLFLEVDEAHLSIVAKAIARCGDEGVAFLHDALESEDAMLRRSAVLGLAEAEARDELERVARDDQDWLVRSAAIVSLSAIEERETICGVPTPSEIDRLPWLISWAAQRGESVGSKDAARPVLWRALQEGEPLIRLAAAQVLAQDGQPSDTEALRTALNDPEQAVASTALEALVEIGNRYDLRIN